jgi:site-specific DNA-methyltransferase (adenine-specific)
VKRIRAKNNRTTFVTSDEVAVLRDRLVYPAQIDGLNFLDKTICGDLQDVANKLPSQFVDLLFIDPPYNLTKNFGNNKFTAKKHFEYEEIFEKWLVCLLPVLKNDASVYVCCDWKTSPLIYNVLSRHLNIRNRITWEREKGRGAASNWKNCSEDIWFATVSSKYTFNVDAVKIKRKVLAPYRVEGVAKDWVEDYGGKFRLTHPSNLWTDITIPFWSMPENTDHPTQKSEKLLAKLILASTDEGNVVLDPFLGSGTTSVVAKKLKRKYVGIELNEEFCCLSEKRLALADKDFEIQGYSDGVFWERNSLSMQSHVTKMGIAHACNLAQVGNIDQFFNRDVML